MCWPPFNVLNILLIIRREWKSGLHFLLFYNCQKKIKHVYTKSLFIQRFVHWQVPSNGILCCRVCCDFPVYFPNNLISVIDRLLFLGSNKWSTVHFIVWKVLWICFPVFYFFITAHIKVIYVLLLLALQPTVDFSLLSDSLPFCSFFTILPPPSFSHYLHIFFDVCNPYLPWSPSSSRTYRFPL